MKPLAMFPQELPCEVCGTKIRVLPLPGVHVLCQECSKELHARIGTQMQAMINAAIIEMREVREAIKP